MKVKKKEYNKMYKKTSPKSPIIKDCFLAFIFGGIICTIGQVLINLFISFGLEKKYAQGWSSIILVALGAFLTAIRVYDNVAKYAGAGTIVPITGFANSIVSPAIEFKSEGYILGTCSQMFTIAGPVLVFGTISSILYGIVAWIFKL